MDVKTKLSILADAAKYDVSCSSSGSRRAGSKTGLGSSEGTGICHSFTPDGRCVSLLKILLTNYCIYDCLYCVNRATSDIPRARFTVDEVVRLTLEFYRRNYIEGLFLSSGIIQSPDYTMEQLIAVARCLRDEHEFHGYIHLKTIPGAAAELIEAAGRLADRLSVNVELPTEADLRQLAPEKRRAEIEGSMGAIRERVDEAQAARKENRKAPVYAPAGQSTQIIVGATGTTDAEMLATSTQLYRRYRLRRIYYSAYSPTQHADGRLPPDAPPLVREHRLYQADWLMRFYGFEAAELTSGQNANLPLDMDPKLAWALAHRAEFPVDVNWAPRRMLLRVPGFGAKSVDRMLRIRRHQKLRLLDLARLHVALNRARAFVITADHNPAARWLDSDKLPALLATPERQLQLFEAAQTAHSGQL